MLFHGSANGINYTKKIPPQLPGVGSLKEMVKAAGLEPKIFKL
jgi:hypothetical protein